MKKLFAALSLATISAASVAAVPAPTVIFSDNFDANSFGLNLAPSGWAVNSGTVDVIGTGFHNLKPGNGMYIDLDGSTQNAGVLVKSLSLLAGTQYTLSFELAGSQRSSVADVVTVSFGSSQTVLNVAGFQAFALSSLVFTPATSGQFDLSFSNAGGDNMGALLDRVQVTAVPEPSAIAMLLAGLGIIGGVARRRKAS